MSSDKIVVLGGGLMGAGIAQCFAAAGHAVTVFEPSEDVRASLHERTRANLQILGADTSIADAITVVANLGEAVEHATFITEAAPEKLDLKRSIFADLINLAPRDCILASNTSVIPITRIAEGLMTADRIVGTHWWNPPFLIPLVEVVRAKSTSDETMQATMSMLESIGKSPAYVQKDTPGFVANRLQHALWREAIAMVAEGVCDPATIDACVKNSFGLRLPVLGPLENADMVGLDLTLDIHRTMMPELDRHDRPNKLLEDLVESGRMGFKSGEGFQSWSDEDMLELREKLLRHLTAANAA